MDFIILNSDGSLQKQSLTRYIQQGSHGVDEIFIGWVNATSSQTLQAVFTLPNQLTNTELGVFEEDYEYEPGETMSGWVITLTENQTRYNGALMVSVRIILNGIVQVAYPFALIINETGVRPETDSGITLAQLDSYLLNIQNLITGAVQANTDAVLSNTSENPVQNKVVTGALTHVEEVAEGKCKSIVLDYALTAFTETSFNNVSGSVYAEDGTELSTWAEYQNYISGRSLGNSLFNSQNNTITINKTDYYFLKQDGYDFIVYTTFSDFKTGDILLVVETEVPDRWFSVYTSSISFYKLETAKVDISNMVTIDTNQTITGVKTFTGQNTFTTDTNLGDDTQSESPKLGFISAESTNQGNWYVYVNNNQQYFNICQLNGNNYVGLKISRSNVLPTNTNYISLGNNSARYKDLYLGGIIYQTNYNVSWDNGIIFKNSSNTTLFYIGSNGQPWVYGDIIPAGTSGTKDLGNITHYFRDLYLSGNLSDGTNSITVANIGKKLYKHTIQTDGGGGADLFIISTRSTVYTLPIDWLSLNTDAIKVLYNGCSVLRIYESSGNYYAQYINDSNTIANSILSASTIEDTVAEL